MTVAKRFSCTALAALAEASLFSLVARASPDNEGGFARSLPAFLDEIVFATDTKGTLYASTWIEPVHGTIVGCPSLRDPSNLKRRRL